MKYLLILVPLVAVTVFVTRTLAESVPEVLIVEVQTGSADSSTQEFVEIHNLSSNTQDLTGWALEYKSSSGTSWTRKAELSGEIAPRGRYLLATSEYLTDFVDEVMSGGLAGTGGHVRLSTVDETGTVTVYDKVGWGTATDSETLPVVAASNGESIKRSINEDGYFIDTDNNSLDLFISTQPTPHSDELPVFDNEVEPEETPPIVKPTTPKPSTSTKPAGNSQTTQKPTAAAQLEISELFIDPDKPLLDDEDEFVELYNSTSSNVNLAGYTIQTGNTFSYSFTLPNVTIKPKSYLAIYSIDSGLTLSNSGGVARLLGPAGQAVDQTEPYEAADPNQAWAKASDASWQWTDQPTPGQTNKFVGADGTTTEAAEGTSLNSSSDLSDRSAVLGAYSSNESDDQSSDNPNTTKAKISKGVLVGLVVAGVLYCCYEYRHNFASGFKKLYRYAVNR